MHRERELLLFCDLHGHSRRKNVFMYGCNNKNDPSETRVYPYLLSKLSPFFSFEYSRFGVQKSKESTARVAVYKELQGAVPNVFTMESSFCGNDHGPFAGHHFTVANFMSVGRDFCRTLLIYCGIPVPPEVQSSLVASVNERKKISLLTLTGKELEGEQEGEQEGAAQTGSPLVKKTL